MSRFAKIAVSTLAATLLLIGLGGLVRATDSGLGCPDWPGCYGRVLPPPGDFHAWVEHIHRYWASVVMALLVWLAYEARRSGQPRKVQRVTLWGLVPLVSLQALLGAVVVWIKLHWVSVSSHLALALLTLGLVTWVVADALRREGLTTPVPAAADGSAPLARVARATAVLVFVQMILGSLVTGFDAGMAYSTFPSFNGDVLPDFDATYAFRQGLHVAHRLVAYGLAAMIVALLVRARRAGTDPVVRRTAALATALVVVQIMLGAANIWGRLQADTVVPHMLVGAMLWTTMLVAAFRSRWQADAVTTPQTAAGPDHAPLAAR